MRINLFTFLLSHVYQQFVYQVYFYLYSCTKSSASWWTLKFQPSCQFNAEKPSLSKSRCHEEDKKQRPKGSSLLLGLRSSDPHEIFLKKCAETVTGLRNI